MSLTQYQVSFNGNAEKQEANVSKLDQISFPFENIVFEGGSNKLLVYCGVLRALEEFGSWGQIRRLAGCGTGAVMAALCAIGYDSSQLEELFQDDLRKASDDESCCRGWKLTSNYGIRNNKRISKWIKLRIKEITGNADVTFSWVKQKFDRELAVAVTDLEQRSLEFCHPKTTPNMTIRQALEMSLASPGVDQPVKFDRMGDEALFLQGGLTCNYPLQCYDGWWLSSIPEDSFLRRLNNLQDLSQATDSSNRFGKFNPKTIGVIVFDDSSNENVSPYLPDCSKDGKKSRSTNSLLRGIRFKSQRETYSLSEEYHLLTRAANKFIQAIERLDAGKRQTLKKQDIQEIIERRVLTDAELRSLFGTNCAPDSIVAHFRKEKLSADDFLNHFEDKRRTAHARLTRDRARPIQDVTSYFEALNETIECYSRVRYFKRRDVDRTVTVSTEHIRRSDRSEHLERTDRRFLVQQGLGAMKAFLERQKTKGGAPDGSYPDEWGEDERGTDRPFDRDDLQRFIDDDVSEVIDARDYVEAYDVRRF